MGVIDSISAGYRFMGRRLYLMLIPVLLDVALWLAPRLSVGPLFERLARFYESTLATEGLSPELSDMAGQAAQVLQELGNQTNLLNMLVSNTLMHVPSIMVVAEPLPGALVRTVDNPLQAIGLSILFSLVGVYLGVVYISWLARHLPIGAGEKPVTLGRLLVVSVRRWSLVVLFLVLTLFLLLAVYVPASIAITLIGLLIPALSSLLLLVLGSITFLVFFYLYFVVTALILDDLSIFDAVVCSRKLVQSNFWSTLGFIIILNLINIGFTLLLAPIVARPPMGTLLGILLSAYIGTGLSMSMLVFYRTRLLKMDEMENQPV